MGKNPYSDLPKSAFWKTGVAQENPYAIEGIYKKKFDIPANAKIATAGSCFAQHISRHLKKNGYNVLDVEPPPPGLEEDLHQKFGFSMYSARYGNIYTVRQLLQLALEVAGEWTPQNYIWERNRKYFDALRPAVEPEGLNSPEEVAEDRQNHISRVKELFENLDLFIFTLGLTEMWIHKESGTVYPTAPGTLVGEFDESTYEFKNAQFGEIIKDFNKFQNVLKKIRGGKSYKILLTVSPVPLTATGSGKHVLISTMYSKSTLRSIAGQLSTNQPHIDYFPSYEIVVNPRMHSTAFTDNLRSVRNETVEIVMRHFFSQHLKCANAFSSDDLLLDNVDVQCEESLIELELSAEGSSAEMPAILVLGNSHSNQVIQALSSHDKISSDFSLSRLHIRALLKGWRRLKWNSISSFLENIPGDRSDLIDQISGNYIFSNNKNVVITGMNLWGDGLIRVHGSLGTSVVNGKTIMSNKPEIPIIEKESDCYDEISRKIFAQVSSCLYYLRKCIDEYPEINFIWVSAPALPEIVARLIFGDEYVDSGSQIIYNRVYENALRGLSAELKLDANILISDEFSLSARGFLLDEYAKLSQPHDIHASVDFYKCQVIPRLKLRS